MSHSIGIPGFVNERRQDILALTDLRQPATVGSKRDRISMYRTRSYLCYRMSRAVKERHKRGPALFTSALPKPKVNYRRQKRLPRMLQSTFGSMVLTPTTNGPNKQKKQKNTSITSTHCVDIGREVGMEQTPGKLRLNTHLWHTKRFKFQCEQGWYIPIKHKSRGLKAVDGLYDKCVIQDVSYCLAHSSVDKKAEHGSIVVTGTIETINRLFALFIDPLEPLITTTDEEGDELVVLEAFEKEAVFHAQQKFPAACVGPVLLLVTPNSSSNALPRTVKVHVTCHPSIASTVYKSLQDAQLSEQTCTVALIPARLNRLRLRGPESAQALLSILHAPASDQLHTENASKLAFLRATLGVRDLSKHFQEGDVISLNLADPRITTTTPAAQVTKTAQDEDPKQKQREMVAALKLRPDLMAATSALFDHHKDHSFETEHEFNKAKHTAKVRKWESLFKTTTPITTTAEVATSTSPAILPVLLIRKATPMRSFKTQKHRLSGWDILLPAVWGSLVFRHLQLRGGAAAVGSEEMDHLLAKSGIPTFPRDFPDTTAGRAFWDALHATESAINEKRPPLKRIVSHNLSHLLIIVAQRAWSPCADSGAHSAVDTSAALIVRGETYLKDFLPPPFENLESAELETATKQAQEGNNEVWVSPHVVLLPALPPLMFLQVVLIPTSRALILDLAELVCPSQEDVAQFVRHKKHTQSKRAHARAAPQDRMDTLATVKGLYRPTSDANNTVKTPIDDTEDLTKEWEGVKLARKPLPSRPFADTNSFTVDGAASKTPESEVKGSASEEKKSVPRAGEITYDLGEEQGRRVIGTVTTGQKEHLNNTHFAIGVCNVNALNEMFRMSYGKYQHPQAHVLVLYRNARSDHLRPAVLQIV